MKMIKKKSNQKALGFQFLRWGLFIPSLVGMSVYIVAIFIELLLIKGKTKEHTRQDVRNARKWFMYAALPFFGERYFSEMFMNMNHLELQRMKEVYGRKPFNERLKIYIPFSARMDAYEAVNLKVGLELWNL